MMCMGCLRQLAGNKNCAHCVCRCDCTAMTGISSCLVGLRKSSLLYPCTSRMFTHAVVLQKTNTQRASAAMQLAASEPISPSVDTDVTAETAALQLQCRDWVRSQERFQLPLKQLAAAMQGSIQEPQQMQGSSQQTQPGQVSSQRPQGMRGAITDCLASLQKLCSRICQMGLGERPWGSASVPCPSCSSDACSSAAVHDETAQNAQPRAPSQPRLASDSVSAVDLAKESNTADAGHLAALNPNSAAIDKLNKADVSPLTQRDVIELEDSCTSLSLNATSMGDR